jgi:hypothetical protein
LREAVELTLDADCLAGAALVADIDFTGRVIAHEHGREAGHYAVVLDKLDDLLRELSPQLLRQLFAVEDGGGHWNGRGLRVGRRLRGARRT